MARKLVVTRNFVVCDDLREAAMAEAKVLFKAYKEKYLSTKAREFVFTSACSCFYGKIFGNSFNDEAFAFKQANKFPLYTDDVKEHGGIHETEYMLLENDAVTSKGMTALEIVSSEDSDFGNAINIAMRFNFKISLEDIMKKNIL